MRKPVPEIGIACLAGKWPSVEGDIIPLADLLQTEMRDPRWFVAGSLDDSLGSALRQRGRTAIRVDRPNDAQTKAIMQDGKNEIPSLLTMLAAGKVALVVLMGDRDDHLLYAQVRCFNGLQGLPILALGKAPQSHDALSPQDPDSHIRYFATVPDLVAALFALCPVP